MQGALRTIFTTDKTDRDNFLIRLKQKGFPRSHKGSILLKSVNTAYYIINKKQLISRPGRLEKREV